MKGMLYKILIVVALIFAIIFALPHSKEYLGWQNTTIACNEYGGCTSSSVASVAIQEYKQTHNLTDDEFQTYIILNNENPPLW